jgi:hypothetical protein
MGYCTSILLRPFYRSRSYALNQEDSTSLSQVYILKSAERHINAVTDEYPVDYFQLVFASSGVIGAGLEL